MYFFLVYLVFLIPVVSLLNDTCKLNTTSMTDQESIDQIVHFFNDVDLSGVSIFSLYTGHMLTIYQDDNLSMCVSESDSDVPRASV